MNVVSSFENRSPSIAFRPFGTTFQRIGTAAIQYSRTTLALAAGGRRHDGDNGEEGQERTERSQPSDDALPHLVTRMSAAMSGPWSMQMKWYFPAFVNVMRDAFGGRPGIPSASGVA